MHTQLPWFVTHHSGLYDGDKIVCISEKNCKNLIAGLSQRAGLDDDGMVASEVDNAEFIVKAVNNHDSLVAALEKCQLVLAGELMTKQSLIDALQAAKDVLEKVKS